MYVGLWKVTDTNVLQTNPIQNNLSTWRNFDLIHARNYAFTRNLHETDKQTMSKQNMCNSHKQNPRFSNIKVKPCHSLNPISLIYSYSTTQVTLVEGIKNQKDEANSDDDA